MNVNLIYLKIPDFENLSEEYDEYMKSRSRSI